jgi:hypothetical protein
VSENGFREFHVAQPLWSTKTAQNLTSWAREKNVTLVRCNKVFAVGFEPHARWSWNGQKAHLGTKASVLAKFQVSKLYSFVVGASQQQQQEQQEEERIAVLLKGLPSLEW